MEKNINKLNPNLMVKDVKETVAFYTDSFGFKLGVCCITFVIGKPSC